MAKRYLVICDSAYGYAPISDIIYTGNTLEDAIEVLRKEVYNEKALWVLHSREYKIYTNSSTEFDIGEVNDYRRYHTHMTIKKITIAED